MNTGGLALDAAGNLYECNLSRRVHWISPSGVVSTYSTGTSELPTVFPNYSVFDSLGNLFWTDSGDWDVLNGRLYVVRPSGETEVAIPDYLAFPNGLALDDENGHLYIVQSSARNILRVSVTAGNVTGRPEIYATLPDRTLPDGLALAQSRNLYISCYEPDVVFVVDPTRRLEVLVEGLAFGLLNRPTNVAFSHGGTDLYFAKLWRS